MDSSSQSEGMQEAAESPGAMVSMCPPDRLTDDAPDRGRSATEYGRPHSTSWKRCVEAQDPPLNVVMSSVHAQCEHVGLCRRCVPPEHLITRVSVGVRALGA